MCLTMIWEQAAPGAKITGNKIRKISNLVEADDIFRQICMDK